MAGTASPLSIIEPNWVIVDGQAEGVDEHGNVDRLQPSASIPRARSHRRRLDSALGLLDIGSEEAFAPFHLQRSSQGSEPFHTVRARRGDSVWVEREAQLPNPRSMENQSNRGQRGVSEVGSIKDKGKKATKHDSGSVAASNARSGVSGSKIASRYKVAAPLSTITSAGSAAPAIPKASAAPTSVPAPRRMDSDRPPSYREHSFDNRNSRFFGGGYGYSNNKDNNKGKTGFIPSPSDSEDSTEQPSVASKPLPPVPAATNSVGWSSDYDDLGTPKQKAHSQANQSAAGPTKRRSISFKLEDTSPVSSKGKGHESSGSKPPTTSAGMSRQRKTSNTSTSIAREAVIRGAMSNASALSLPRPPSDAYQSDPFRTPLQPITSHPSSSSLHKSSLESLESAREKYNPRSRVESYVRTETPSTGVSRSRASSRRASPEELKSQMGSQRQVPGARSRLSVVSSAPSVNTFANRHPRSTKASTVGRAIKIPIPQSPTDEGLSYLSEEFDHTPSSLSTNSKEQDYLTPEEAVVQYDDSYTSSSPKSTSSSSTVQVVQRERSSYADSVGKSPSVRLPLPQLKEWRSGPLEVQSALYGDKAEEENDLGPEDRIFWYDDPKDNRLFKKFYRDVQGSAIEAALGKLAFSRTFDERGGRGAVLTDALEREVYPEGDEAGLSTFWMSLDDAMSTSNPRILELIGDYDPEHEFVVIIYILPEVDFRTIELCGVKFTLDRVDPKWRKKWKAGHPPKAGGVPLSDDALRILLETM